jgi:hypothetical protein
VDSKVVTFWPDEWKKVVGDENAVGNFIHIYIPLSNDRTDLSWRRGRVVEYIAEEDMHRIVLDSAEGTGSAGSTGAGLTGESSGVASTTAESSDESVTEDNAISANRSVFWERGDLVKIVIDDCKHVWYDNGQRQKNLTGKKHPNIQNHLLLDYSPKDVGRFCRVWWTRYSRFFYARITAFDIATRIHHMIYEDGDANKYDMTTKVYETIHLPASFNFNDAEDDGACALKVSIWHLKMLAKQLEVDSAAPETPAKLFSTPDTTSTDMAALRPVASLAHGASAYQFAVINAYFAEVSV